MNESFIASRSGYIRLSQGLSAGWIAVALFAVALLLGPAQQASAEYCYNIPEDDDGWVCFPDQPYCPSGHGGQDQCNSVHYFHDSLTGCIPVSAGCCNCYS